LAEAKGLKPDTVTGLQELEYDSVLAVSTLTEDQIAGFKFSQAQKGILGRWVDELNTKHTKTTLTRFSNEDRKDDLQSQVDKRLRQLGLTDDEDTDDEDKMSSVKGKQHTSGRNKTVSDVIKKCINWPHFYVFRGINRTPATYDNLSLPEFVYGTMCQIKDAKPEEAAALQDQLRNLMADAMKYNWELVRSYHGMLLQMIEQGRFSWGQDTTFLREQNLRAPLPTNIQTNTQQHQDRAVFFCAGYQTGACYEVAAEHDSNQGTVHHVCAYCLRRAGKSCYHPEMDCKRKSYDRQNEH